MQPASALASLRAQVRQIEGRHRHASTVLPFGLAEVDSRLPDGGLALGALHEVAGGDKGAIDGAGAALFTAGIAAHTTGKILWCVTRPDLFAPALALLRQRGRIYRFSLTNGDWFYFAGIWRPSKTGLA